MFLLLRGATWTHCRQRVGQQPPEPPELRDGAPGWRYCCWSPLTAVTLRNIPPPTGHSARLARTLPGHKRYETQLVVNGQTRRFTAHSFNATVFHCRDSRRRAVLRRALQVFLGVFGLLAFSLVQCSILFGAARPQTGPPSATCVDGRFAGPAAVPAGVIVHRWSSL